MAHLHITMMYFRRSMTGMQRVMSELVGVERRSFVTTSKACVRNGGEKRSARVEIQGDLLRSSVSSSKLRGQLRATGVREIVEPRSTIQDPDDPLKKAISASDTIEELQRVIQGHHHVMKPQHLMDCMLRFRDLAHDPESKFSAAKDPSFWIIEDKLLSTMHSYTLDDSLQLARVVGNLKLDCSHSLVQEIYRSLERQVSGLNIDQIMHLWASLKTLRGESDPTDALSFSLPVMFETEVKQQLDATNGKMCLDALSFVAAADVRREIRDFVVDSARKFLPQASLPLVAQIVNGTAFRKQPHAGPHDRKMHAVLEYCLGVIAENISRFDSKSIRRIMFSYSKIKIFRRELQDALWSLAPNWSLDEIMRLVRLSVIKDAISLKDAALLRDLLLIHREAVENAADYGEVLRCSQVMSLLAIHSPGVDSRLEEIGRHLAVVLERQDIIQKNPRLLTRFMLDLVTLGIYPDRDLKLLFSKQYQKTLSGLSSFDLSRLLDLERLLYLHFGRSSKYVVIPELKKKAATLRSRTVLSEDLVECMRTALGGDQFLLKRLMTPMGVEADLAVVYRRYPIALANKESPLKNLPDDCKVIAVLQCVANRDIIDCTATPRVQFALRERFLREQNICPVVIKMSEWETIPAKRRILFLKSKIREGLLEFESNGVEPGRP